MSTTHTPDTPEALNMPDPVRTEAEDLIRDLASVAGDGAAVHQRLAEHLKSKSLDHGIGALAAALIVIFADCITDPLAPGEFTELTYPTE